MPREMKDSGIEWLGQTPIYWNTKKAFQIFSQVKNKNEGLVETNLLSLSYGKIKRKSIDTVEGLLPESFDGYNIIEANDIVLRLTDLQNDHTSLRVGLSNERGIITSAYLTLRCNSNNYPKYLYYYLHSFDIAKGFYGMGAGVRQGLNWDGVKSLQILIPSIPEQKAIADFLDKQCAEIDAVIAKTKATIEEYKKLKQSVITEAVTKGIRGDRPMKDSGIEWMGDIPTDWNLIQIKHLKSKDKNAFVDGPFGSNLKSIHFVENGDVYVVESGFITTGKFVFKKFKTITSSHFETIKRSECKANDVIIAKIGANFGMAAELPKLDKPSVVSGNSLKITLDQAKILNSIFVYELGIAKNRGGYVGLYNETAQPALSLSTLNSFKLVVAPIEEQKEIANYLYGKCAEIDTLIAKKTALLEEMETYKKSVIYEYVTGKKEVL